MEIKLNKAIEERDKFLEANSHLRIHQKKIDDILNKCKEEDRLDVIQMMMYESLSNLVMALNKLKEKFNNG